MSKDYYKILELDKKVDDKAIKTSFRRLARKFHPDLNPNDKTAEARFKEINEAYEVLGDAEKRKLYDSYGSNWENAQRMGDQDFGGGGVGGPDIGDMFSHIFHNFGGGGPGVSQQPQRKPQVPPRDVEKVVEITLNEIDTGTKRTLTYQVPDVCKSCDGSGQVRVRTGRTCPTCRGQGQVRSMLGFAQICDECGGSGQLNTENCPSCAGTGALPTTKKVEVTIPAGISNGKKLRVPGRGGLGSNGRAGDLYVIIKELPHPQFVRDGESLVTEIAVPYSTAVLGGEIRVPTLTGAITMTLKPLSQPGQKFRLGAQGIHKMKGGKGDLMVKI
ncbi:MAG: J domain-containing protein, partial [Armatimonadetes bacterium]|nr:J domain-containing protein [Armatimonadota bacterium]